MKKRAYSSLLNKPGHESTAAISSYVQAVSDWGYISGELSISDCNRQINLSLHAGNKKDANNAVFKLNKLISILQKTRLAYLITMDEAEEYKASKEKVILSLSSSG